MKIVKDRQIDARGSRIYSSQTYMLNHNIEA